MPDSVPKQDLNEVALDGSLYESKASPALIAEFEMKAIKVVCSDHEILFRRDEAGESVYLVLTGQVRLLLALSTTDGMEFLARPGSFVGLPAAFSNEPYSMTAIACKEAELAVMSRDRFCDMIASNPNLALDVLRILAAETRTARMAIVDAGMSHRGGQRI